jgi:hypothetical protein
MGSSGISSLGGGQQQISAARMEQFKKTREAALDAAADSLGESPDDLQNELQSGKSLSDIASAHGVSQDKLLDAVKQAVKSSDPNLSDDQVGNVAQRLVSGHHHHHGGHPAEAPAPSTGDDSALPSGSTISVKA